VGASEGDGEGVGGFDEVLKGVVHVGVDDGDEGAAFFGVEALAIQDFELFGEGGFTTFT